MIYLLFIVIFILIILDIKNFRDQYILKRQIQNHRDTIKENEKIIIDASKIIGNYKDFKDKFFPGGFSCNQRIILQLP